MAARSVTLLLQKQYSSVERFDNWYSSFQTRFASDSLVHFLLEKRNFVLKEGQRGNSFHSEGDKI